MIKILLVDDSEFERQVTLKLVEELGHELVVVGNYDDAIKVYKKSKIDLTLLDILMEGKDGVDVLLAIRNINPKAKILFVSSLTDGELENLVKANKANGFVTKPFTKTTLSTAIAQALK